MISYCNDEGRTAMSASHLIEDDAPVYVGVKRALRQRLGSQWRVGDRLPPVADLARLLGVGQNNAHRAVRDLVAEGVLITRRRLGTFVRRLPLEVRDTAALSRTLQGVTIALGFNKDQPPPFIQRMIDGFREVAQDAGADTVLFPRIDEGLNPPAGVWGCVLFNPSTRVEAKPGKMNLAVVSTSDHIHPSLLSRFDSVLVDHYQGGSLAGRLLRDLGCQRPCFLGRRVAVKRYRYDITSSLRLHGLEMGYGELMDDQRLIYTPNYSVLSGGKRFAVYLEKQPRPDGVFCASDEIALGFMAAASSHGMVAGRDFQLIGFDGQDNEVDGPAGAQLTTVRVPATMMGRRAAELMIQRAADPTRPVQRVLLPCTLSSGDTTRPSPRSLR
jgi:LacI family repressor for deo operon, udp, cdd, tsx, nupC, and nupG